MKTNIEFLNGKNTPLSNYQKIILKILTLVLLISIPLYLRNNSPSALQSVNILVNASVSLSWKNGPSSTLQSPQVTTNDSKSASLEQKCNIFSGSWVLNRTGTPYYTNETICEIDERQNCMKFGRPDTEFMKWRWKPDACELPLFDAFQFLELVRGKTMAFVGDSVARNQMQSLVCLLASAAYPIDVTYTPDGRFRRWHYTDYNFTVAALWAPLLVKAREADPSGFSFNTLMNLYLDEADESWTTQVEKADIVIVSAGQWFFRPYVYYEKGNIVGCHKCNRENITDLSVFYGYKMAFRTTFQTLLSLKNYKGLTFLRTYSPSHYENGDWDKGGNCVRTRPFSKQEMKLDGYELTLYSTQAEELRAAEKEGVKRGMKFRLLSTTEAMVMRPDGHPSYYGHWPGESKTKADCAHWCMPGPVDTWNEFLLQMLKMEGEGLVDDNLQRNT